MINTLKEILGEYDYLDRQFPSLWHKVIENCYLNNELFLETKKSSEPHEE